MQQVNITATYYNKEFSGTFPLVSINSGDKYCTRDKYVTLVRDGKTITVQAFEHDIQIVGAGPIAATPTIEMTDAELDKLIRSRFSILDMMGTSIVEQDIRALIVSGAPGVGKTFDLEGKLMQAEASGKANKVSHIKGRLHGLALMQMLYEHRNPGDILLLDDVDNVFSDEDDMNLLKGALDTSKRIVGWNTASNWLEEQGIPQQFEFEGAIVFITNKNFDKIIERGGSMAEHMKALISRSNYLDLKCHTNREVLIRVSHLLEAGEILVNNGLTAEQGEEIFDFLRSHVDELRELSARTLIKVGQYIKANPANWVDMARVMCCK